MTEEPKLRELPNAHPEEEISFLDIVRFEDEPNQSDPFFEQYLLDPERFLIEIQRETAPERALDLELLGRVVQRYTPILEEYYRRSPISYKRVLTDRDEPPHIAIGFEGVAEFADGIEECNETQTNPDRQAAFSMCLDLYQESIRTEFERDSQNLYDRRYNRGTLSPRVVHLHNFLAVAWSTRSHHAAIFAQSVMNDAQTTKAHYMESIDRDLKANFQAYKREANRVSTEVLDQIAGRFPEISIALNDGQSPLRRLQQTLSHLDVPTLVTLTGLEAFNPIVARADFRIMAGLHRHFSIMGDLSATFSGLQRSAIPKTILMEPEFLAAHELLMMIAQRDGAVALVQNVYETFPIDYQGYYPINITDLYNRSLGPPPNPDLRYEAISAVRLFARKEIGIVHELLLPDTEQETVTPQPHKSPPEDVEISDAQMAAQFGVTLIALLKPDILYHEVSEKITGSTRARRLRRAIKRNGWQALSIPGNIFSVDQNPHLRRFGLESFSIQFAPYFWRGFNGGYIATLRVAQYDKPINLLLTGLDDVMVVIPQEGRYRTVPIKIPRANKNFIVRFILEHLEPLKRATHEERSDRTTEQTTEHAEAINQQRKVPYYLSTRRHNETRPVYRRGERAYQKFVTELREKGYTQVEPDELWAHAEALLRNLAQQYKDRDLIDEYATTTDGIITGIDSIIFRMLFAREISLDQIIEFGKAAQNRFKQTATYKTGRRVQPQIHITNLSNLARRKADPVILPQAEARQLGT